jgi:hypothetical protein
MEPKSTEAITLCGSGVLSDWATECLSIANQGVGGFHLAETGAE